MAAGRRWQGKPTHFSVHGGGRRLTAPAVRGRSRRRPWESQPTVGGSLGPQPAEAPSSPPAPAVVWSSPPAAAVICQASRLWSRQPAAAVLTSQPAVAEFDQTVTTVFLTVFVCSPRRAPDTPSFPKEILGGGSRAPAEETEVGAGAAVSEAVPPWPPELPAPPWPPELPAPPWPPELPAPPGPRSVCSTLEAPSCVCICVGPVGSPECPPPLPGSTVTARDVPSGRGSYVRDLSCASCGSRLLFLYLVCFLSVVIIVYSCHLLC